MCLHQVCFSPLVSQVETTPSQFTDTSVYLWNISNSGALMKVDGFSVPPLRRGAHCADYATIRQQVWSHAVY